MKEENIISLPCSGLVKKALIAEYGQEPIRVLRDTELGILLDTLSSKKSEKIFLTPSAEVRNFEYTDNIKLQLPARMAKKTCSISAMIQINNLTKRRFKTKMFAFVEGMLWSGVANAHKALFSYLKKSEITEEEYKLETAKREWSRHLSRNQKQAQKAA